MTLAVGAPQVARIPDTATTRVGILGATGYSGMELLRLLAAHPQARIVAAASRQFAGQPLAAACPGFASELVLDDDPLDPAAWLDKGVQTVFAANVYQDTPLLRGVYFTSGTQEGRPIDRVMRAMASAFGIQGVVPEAEAAVQDPKSYFLRDVFGKVIF